MAIDFEMTSQQRKLKYDMREFAHEVVAPCAERGDASPDPQDAFLAMKPAFESAHKLGLPTSFLPKKYGGGGLKNVDFLIAAEELCAVDPGFATTVLVNGLALMPLTWYGSEAQCERWIGQATKSGKSDYLAGWVVSERGGTANFDHPSPNAGIQLVADFDAANEEYVLNGEKHWPCNSGGWDLKGADTNLCVVRTDRTKGGKGGLSALLVDRGTAGITYEVIDKVGHRTCQNVTMTFKNARVPLENLLAEGDGDLLINRNFTWSGPVASIASVGVARAAFEFALNWSKTFTGGGSTPIINHQGVGNLLAEIAGKIEAARYMSWKAAHYMDKYDSEGQALGGMSKTFSGELMQQVVFDCMRVVGVNAVDKKFPMERYYREALIFPLYDAGNLAMQRRKVWGVMADVAYTHDIYADCDPIEFKKSMEGFGLGNRSS
ncbi:acyl-CoA dehydrogenase family protein [Sulfitobacter sp. S190]|uniref:acyl-CoA dehydrogenase family protein n=1 Tax=Sulfitobacter sp. S190 TaxID=2867022 RepID=UPI0021A4779F|nr:acyl-CoA dehydrogenase family protein [Sulfitobacter sp. S190]UWR24597.1 acyl-CoA/acyl-ACP dehydrogenase [Sulfitobacter sp. S190]